MYLTEFDILDIYVHNQKHLFTRKPEVGCDLGGIRIFTMRLNVLQLRNGKQIFVDRMFVFLDSSVQTLT